MEEQYDDANQKQRILGVSSGVSFEFVTNGTKDHRIRNVLFKGQPLEMTKTYQVTVSENMLDGSVLAEGLNRLGAGGDLEAFKAYMKGNSPVSPPPDRSNQNGESVALKTGSHYLVILKQKNANCVRLRKRQLRS